MAYTMNMLGPMMQMANAAANQGVDIGKQKLREFIENSDTARQALNMPQKEREEVRMDNLDSKGKKTSSDDDEI